MSVMMFSEALSAHAQDLLGMEREQMGGEGRNMTKECMAIKTGMLLNYADEPCELSPKMITNDELGEIEIFFVCCCYCVMDHDENRHFFNFALI